MMKRGMNTTACDVDGPSNSSSEADVGTERLRAGAPPPSTHLRLIMREHNIFPATKESYRVYVGANDHNSSMDLV